MSSFDFKGLTPYIMDEQITDINISHNQLWVDHLQKGRFLEKDFLLQEDFSTLCYRLANYANLPFNAAHPVVESETEDLRISLLHESVAKAGYSLSIRKTPAIMRLKKEELIKSHYAKRDLLSFLEQLVLARCNILICGLPGSGKTELVKYLTNFIPSYQRVITIEDTLEIRYRELHPNKDSVALKVNENFSYVDAIKASLRQRPDWLLVSEVRSHEVVSMLEAVSTGAKLISTLHADDATSIPQRLLHMFPGVELSNDIILQTIYENIDIGIHVEAQIGAGGITRQITQLVAFDINSNGEMHTHILYDDLTSLVTTKLPKRLERRLTNGLNKEEKGKRKRGGRNENVD